MSEERKVIHFYSTKDEYGCFSNFAPYPIQLKKRIWPTVEHYFQAQKFPGTEREEEIRQASSPMLARRMGRSKKHKLRASWDSARDAIMLEAVRAKFDQHADLRARLLDTGDAQLVEHTERDAYWGDGGDGYGKNMLGQILMAVRAELQAAAGK
jgi:hypothetical protein